MLRRVEVGKNSKNLINSSFSEPEENTHMHMVSYTRQGELVKSGPYSFQGS